MKSQREFVSSVGHARCSYFSLAALAVLSSQLLGVAAPDEPQTASSQLSSHALEYVSEEARC